MYTNIVVTVTHSPFKHSKLAFVLYKFFSNSSLAHNYQDLTIILVDLLIREVLKFVSSLKKNKNNLLNVRII